MKAARPLLLRILPDWLRGHAWFRLYRPTAPRWHPLYDDAPLRFAPNISMQLIPGDGISDQIAFTGTYELDLSRKVANAARQGGMMIDVGANIGYFSLLWAGASPNNRSIAFEAAPRNVKLLGRNISKNGLDPQIQVIPKAAGREAGTLGFDVGPDDQTGWGGFSLSPTQRTIEVDVVRIDEQVDENATIDFLKIDIEGADTWALAGCERLFRQRRVKQVWFEQNKPRMQCLGIDEREAETFLQSVGYLPRPASDPSAAQVEWTAVPK